MTKRLTSMQQAEQAEESQKKQLKGMKEKERQYFQFKMIVTFFLSIIGYVIFFILIKVFG